MTKIIDCPECGESRPVRNDAEVCSPRCRLRKWRKSKREVAGPTGANTRKVVRNEQEM